MPLSWQQVGKHLWQAVDGPLRYRVKMGEGFRWRVRMNNVPIGESYESLEEAIGYVEREVEEVGPCC